MDQPPGKEPIELKPGDQVSCKRGTAYHRATVVKISFPFQRTLDDMQLVQFCPIPEPNALVRFEDGEELLAPLGDIEQQEQDKSPA